MGGNPQRGALERGGEHRRQQLQSKKKSSNVKRKGEKFKSELLG